MSAQYRHQHLQKRRQLLSDLIQSLLHVDADDPRLPSLILRALHNIDPIHHHVSSQPQPLTHRTHQRIEGLVLTLPCDLAVFSLLSFSTAEW